MINDSTLYSLIAVGVIVFLVILYCGRVFFRGGICSITSRLEEKIVFITGSNAGIGRITAIELAKRGATIIIACRDQIKGQEVAIEIQNLGLALPRVLPLDLMDLKSVDECVRILEETSIKHIDILINNAGIMAPKQRDLTKQGFESQLGVNHIGHFYLTNKLLPFLQNATQSRVINVSSIAHEWGPINYADINYDNVATSSKWKSHHSYQAYGASKLMNILHAKELNQRYEMADIGGMKAVSIHPGVVRTNLFNRSILKNFWPLVSYILLYPFVCYCMKTPLQGTQTTLYCALENYDKLKGGAYYADCKEKQTRATLQEAARVWQLSEDLILQRHQ